MSIRIGSVCDMATLSRNELKLMDEYFRVLNYLSVAQLYLINKVELHLNN